jgi:HPt (histidine-containing phosphotransfer) domain-containing protein
MDVQMPEMDGFEATAIIRQCEATSDRKTPIVAMTAHAMQGDRERCLEAGMDAYLAKPIQPDNLMATIARLVKPREASDRDVATEARPIEQENVSSQPAASETTASIEGADESATLDVTALLARVEGDWDLLHEMCELFMQSSPLLLAEIETGINGGDGATIERAAHALKGAMQNIGAVPASRTAGGLEAVGRTGNIDRADELLVTLKREFEQLATAISEQSMGGHS